ncbi:hypothetical protein [Agrobacterium sp. MCAB5]|uniref:hypothetical protein n=1 Tax=Agrobacterium sp. MCAB5 TaxID=3233042 RepID=UPI003F929AA2
MSEQMTRVTDVVDLLNKVCFVQYNTGWSSTSLAKDAAAEITRLRQLLSEAEKREREARAEALEEAALWHDSEVARYTAQIAQNDEYLKRVGSSESCRANEYCDDQRSTHRRSAAHLRSLARAALERSEG